MPCSDFRTRSVLRKSKSQIFHLLKSSVSTGLVLKAEQLPLYATYYQKWSSTYYKNILDITFKSILSSPITSRLGGCAMIRKFSPAVLLLLFLCIHLTAQPQSGCAEYLRTRQGRRPGDQSGKGTFDDPKRPMYAPSPAEVQAAMVTRQGILGFSYVTSDDGHFALVEFVARDRFGVSRPILSDANDEVIPARAATNAKTWRRSSSSTRKTSTSRISG